MFVHSFLASIKSCFLDSYYSRHFWATRLGQSICRQCHVRSFDFVKQSTGPLVKPMWTPNWENLKKGEYWVYSHLTGSVKWWCWEVCQMILCYIIILIWYVSQDSLASYDPGYILLSVCMTFYKQLHRSTLDAATSCLLLRWCGHSQHWPLTQTQVWLARVNYCRWSVCEWSLRKVTKSWPPSFLKLAHFEHELFIIIGPKIWRIKTARVRFHLTVPVTMAGVDDLQISYQDLKLSCARRRKLQV